MTIAKAFSYGYRPQEKNEKSAKQQQEREILLAAFLKENSNPNIQQKAKQLFADKALTNADFKFVLKKLSARREMFEAFLDLKPGMALVLEAQKRYNSDAVSDKELKRNLQDMAKQIPTKKLANPPTNRYDAKVMLMNSTLDAFLRLKWDGNYSDHDIPDKRYIEVVTYMLENGREPI